MDALVPLGRRRRCESLQMGLDSSLRYRKINWGISLGSSRFGIPSRLLRCPRLSCFSYSIRNQAFALGSTGQFLDPYHELDLILPNTLPVGIGNSLFCAVFDCIPNRIKFHKL